MAMAQQRNGSADAAAAASAEPGWSAAAPRLRALALELIAERLAASADELIALAGGETHLREARLSSELRRTTAQLQLFAGLLRDGEVLEATIDRPDPNWPSGPRPDLRSVLVGLGPVLVFAGGNFPFAFSVAGGDTASALAAGCPVLVKVHPGHPRLSDRTAALVSDALAEAGAPAGTFALIHGEAEGRAVLADPRVAAGAFTGSHAGGRALYELACLREVPIPFYAEMGSLNPVFVTREALTWRREEIVAGYVASYTLDAGQFCTKPGFLVVPEEMGVEEAVAACIREMPAQPLLNSATGDRYQDALWSLRDQSAVTTVVAGDSDREAPTPSLLAISARSLLANAGTVLTECFGPTSVVVGYRDDDELLALAGAFGGQLTATVHAERGEEVAVQLLERLAAIAGRVLWNDWPTGVAVSYAMQHGGPYPATTSPLHTSVGTAAIRRFQRPVAYQGIPDPLLPPPLQEANPWGLPRRVDGRCQRLVMQGEPSQEARR